MVAKPRSNRRQIAALSFLLRAILDGIATIGGPKGDAHRAALELVDGFACGAAPSPEALKAARAGVAKAVARLGVGSPPAWKALYWLPVEALLQMVERGDDTASLVLEHAGYALSSARVGGLSSSFEAMHARATAQAAAFDDAPLARRKKSVPREVSSREVTLLAQSRATFTGEARALYDFARPERDAARTVDRATLSQRLKAVGLPASGAVLDFEESFGGLLIPVTTFDDWREDGLYVQVGPAAMLATHPQIPVGGTTAQTKRLVPVARGTQEDIYFLDELGMPYYHHTMGEPGAVPFGGSGGDLVARLAFGALTYASQQAPGTAVFPPLSRVASAARELGLTRLFADDTSAWWFGDAAVIVVFRGQVWGLARNEAALALLASSG